MKGTVAGSNWQRRLAVGVILALVAMLVLLRPPPARAFDAGNIFFPDFPTTAASGTHFSFSLLVTIPQYEYVKIGGITLYMFRSDNRAAYQATCSALPLNTETRSYSEADTAGGKATVYATAEDKWNLTQGLGYGPGPTSIKYFVVWDIPDEWRAGPGQVEARVFTGNTTSYLRTASFAMTLPAPLGGTIVPQSMNGAGVFTQSFTASSTDGRARLTINPGTKGLVRGQLLSEIDIIRLMMPPPPPPRAVIVDRTFSFGPEGTTFEAPVTLTITYDPAEIPKGVDEKNLFLATWNSMTGGWDSLNSNVDAVNHTVTAQATHFSIFGIVASTNPAAFAVSNLTVSPATADTDKPVTIGVTVSNTGDLSGVLALTLKIDGIPADSKNVTVVGKSSQKVTFTASGSTLKSYVVEVNGLAGTFTVNRTSPPPTTSTPTPSPSLSPSTPLPSTKPAPTTSATTTAATPKPSPSSPPSVSPSPTAPALKPSPSIKPAPDPEFSSLNVDWWPVLRVFIPIGVLFALGLWLIISSLRQR